MMKRPPPVSWADTLKAVELTPIEWRSPVRSSPLRTGANAATLEFPFDCPSTANGNAAKATPKHERRSILRMSLISFSKNVLYGELADLRISRSDKSRSGAGVVVVICPNVLVPDRRALEAWQGRETASFLRGGIAARVGASGCRIRHHQERPHDITGNVFGSPAWRLPGDKERDSVRMSPSD
jgi:hypothetical protein